jgi:3-hydroxyisobutyrate dehydrogenase-like beta-hydroxyacid dehydrogenase
MANDHKIGWIAFDHGLMAECLIKAGYDGTIWNHTRARLSRSPRRAAKSWTAYRLAGVDVVFSIVSTSKDQRSIRQDGLSCRAADGPENLVDCSTIAVEDRPTSASGSRGAASISWQRRSPATPR